MHLARGWRDIGYHAVVTKKGGTWHIEPGRPERLQGAHAGRGFKGNKGSLGICIAGNYVDEMPEYDALNCLLKQCNDWMEEYGDLEIWGHCDLNTTACPGLMLYSCIPAIINDVGSGVSDLRGRFYVERKLAEDRTKAREFFIEQGGK
jgi:hypothetical protein